MSTPLKSTTKRSKLGLSSTLKTDFDDNPENIEEYISVLTEHQKLFEKNGKFMEAENTKKKVIQLKAQLQNRFISDMKKDHSRQRSQIDKAHQQQMKSFNSLKTSQMNQYKYQTKMRQQELLGKQEQELKAYKQQVERNNSLKLKQSPQLINLRKIMDTLAKQQNYIEAHKIQCKIHALQKQQNPKFATDRSRKISNLIQQFNQKQQTEMKVLKQKLKLGLEQKKKMFDYQQNKLKQKYQNTKSELQFNHKLEIQKFEKQRKLAQNRLTVSKSALGLK